MPSSSKSPKPQSAKSQQPEPDQSYDPSSFSDTFRAMARESLVKNQKNRPDSPIVSISPVLIVLGAIAAALYGLWQSWACLIPLVLILVLMWVRYTMQRQALNEFRRAGGGTHRMEENPRQPVPGADGGAVGAHPG